jgi:immunoglobulin-like protein involved in spore germination
VYYVYRVVGGGRMPVVPQVRREKMAREIDDDSGRPFIKINHPAPGDVIRNPAHIAGYGTAFEGTISLRIRDDDGTVIAEGFTQGGSNGVIGEFKADLEFDRRPNQRLGVVEAFEESASGSGEERHLFRVPIVFG